MSFMSYQTQKLAPQRIMVKTTWKPDLLSSAIFSVIVYCIENAQSTIVVLS